MYGEKRARQIEYKARKQRESLAGVSNTAPLNVQVRLRAYCMIWELKQKYYKQYMEENEKADTECAKGFLISADEEEQIRQSEEYKQYMEEHKEDK